MGNRGRAAAIAGVLAASLSLAACGGGGADDSSDVASLGTDAATTQAREAADTASGDGGDPYEFAKCMRENGVEDFPDPNPDGGLTITPSSGVRMDDPETEKAFEKCRPLMGAPRELTADQRAALQDGLIEFARCMREHGIDMPDPQVGDGAGVQMLLPKGVSPESPTFQEAQKACQPELDEATRNAGLPAREERS